MYLYPINLQVSLGTLIHRCYYQHEQNRWKQAKRGTKVCGDRWPSLPILPLSHSGTRGHLTPYLFLFLTSFKYSGKLQEWCKERLPPEGFESELLPRHTSSPNIYCAFSTRKDILFHTHNPAAWIQTAALMPHCCPIHRPHATSTDCPDITFGAKHRPGPPPTLSGHRRLQSGPFPGTKVPLMVLAPGSSQAGIW